MTGERLSAAGVRAHRAAGRPDRRRFSDRSYEEDSMTRRTDGKRNPRYRSRTAKPAQISIQRAASLRELSHGSHSKENTDKLFEEAANSSDRNSCIILCSYLE